MKRSYRHVNLQVLKEVGTLGQKTAKAAGPKAQGTGMF